MKNQDEINLINFFTRNKSLTRAQRARFESLVARDLIHSDAETLEVEKNKEDEIHYHSPKKMIEFLSLFSRDDRFKWFTHKWDMREPFKIDDFIWELKKNKEVLQDMAYTDGPVVNHKTYNHVWNFINFDNKTYTWKNTSFENIKYGWHSIVELSKKSPQTPVENLTLDDGHQFKDYIRMFKSTIEFRTDLKDDDRFSELIWNNIKSGLPKDFKIEFSEEFDEIGYNLNIYCDVIAIITAIRQICNWIVQFKSRSSEVCVDLKKENTYYVLSIFHKNSYFTNISKLENPSGDLNTLREGLFSVCDLVMIGDLKTEGEDRKTVNVKVLDVETVKSGNSMSQCEVEYSEEKTGGVKYVFKFYTGV